MKKLSLMIWCFMYCVGAISQQDSILRNFKLFVIEKKGNSDAYAFFSSNSVQVPLVKKGVINFNHVLPQDTLVLVVGQKNYFIQSKGLDSIYLVIHRNKVKAYKDQPSGQEVDIHAAPPSSLKIAHIEEYASLADYMKGRMAGVNVVQEGSQYSIYIRGTKSILLDNRALIVLDGMVMDDFDSVNKMLNVNDIKSVEVEKDGVGYGSRGANGVVIITTKKADD